MNKLSDMTREGQSLRLKDDVAIVLRPGLTLKKSRLDVRITRKSLVVPGSIIEDCDVSAR